MNTVVFIRTRRGSQRNPFLLLLVVIFICTLALALPGTAYADDGDTDASPPAEIIQPETSENTGEATPFQEEGVGEPIDSTMVEVIPSKDEGEDVFPQEDIASDSVDSTLGDADEELPAQEETGDAIDSVPEDSASVDTINEETSPQDQEGTDAPSQEDAVDSTLPGIVQPAVEDAISPDEIIPQEELPVSVEGAQPENEADSYDAIILQGDSSLIKFSKSQI